MIELRTGLVGSGAGSAGGETDLLIAGGGPAALAAALYASRYGISHVVAESWQPGGQAALTARIENYPGIESITGGDLAAALRRHAAAWGASFEASSVVSAKPSGNRIEVVTDAASWSARTLIVATGAAPSRLGVPGEEEFYGRGVSYCATCDAPFFRGKTVMVVGGGDSAVKEALHLAGFADRLYVVHRRDRLRAEPLLVEKLLGCDRCSVYWSSTLLEIRGSDGVESVLLRTPGGEAEVPVDGVFMYVGRTPATAPFRDLIDLNPDGTVRTHDVVHTSRENVFAAGDVTDNELRQVVTAVSDGARAAAAAFELLQRDEGGKG